MNTPRAGKVQSPTSTRSLTGRRPSKASSIGVKQVEEEPRSPPAADSHQSTLQPAPSVDRISMASMDSVNLADGMSSLYKSVCDVWLMTV